MKTFSATEAKNTFGVVLEAAIAEPVEIVKNGKTVAVVVSARKFADMEGDYALTRAKRKLMERDPLVVGVLISYSRTAIGSAEAMQRLGLKFQGQLLDLLGMTNLPFPSLPQTRIDAMVTGLLSAGEHA